MLFNAGPPPSLSFNGYQALNMRNLDGHTRGADFNVEVYAVLGHLKDATDKVKAIMDADPTFYFPEVKPRPIRIPATPALRDKTLDTKPPTWERLVFEDKKVAPTGDIFYVDRVTTPRRLAIYRPASLKTHPDTDQQDEPLKYHVPYAGHAMIYQHEAFDACKMIFVFPVGSPSSQMGDITTQDGMLRLLQEVNYFIQRIDGVPYPLQPVGDVALSAFSAGLRNMRKILTSPTNELFFNVLLKELYILDGVLSPDSGGELYKSFIKGLLTWWQDGDSMKTFRLYTQTLAYYKDLKPHVTGGQETTGAANSHEIDADRATLIYVPANDFWQPILHKTSKNSEKNYNFWYVHQLIPSMFMTHALEHSAF